MELIVRHIYHKERVSIAKRSNPLNPVQWNVLAIVFVLGIMPFAVAFISNAGASTDESWSNSMQHHDQPFDIADNSKWLDNGGSNLTSWYQTYYPPNFPEDLDCAYIKDGFCEGYYDDSVFNYNLNDYPELQMGLSHPWGTLQGYSGFQSHDYYGVRTTEASQSHRNPLYNTNNPYAGTSGSEIFSWYLSPLLHNEIGQGETIDSIRYLFLDENSFTCNDPLSWSANITFEGEISFIYGNNTLKYQNFDFDKNTKLQSTIFDEGTGQFYKSCSIGFYVEFDLTGFESLELHSFINQGDWDNTSTIVTLKNFENKDQDDFGTTKLPFTGGSTFRLGVQHQQINPVEVGFFIKTGTLILGVATLAIALASTPYWDPFRNFFKGMVD